MNLTAEEKLMYEEGHSAGFELTERATGEILFSMDIDVNRPIPPTKTALV